RAAEILGVNPETETVNAALRYVAATARWRFLDDARQGAFASLTDPDERAEAWRSPASPELSRFPPANREPVDHLRHQPRSVLVGSWLDLGRQATACRGQTRRAHARRFGQPAARRPDHDGALRVGQIGESK